jgi:hypothetical protein
MMDHVSGRSDIWISIAYQNQIATIDGKGSAREVTAAHVEP